MKLASSQKIEFRFTWYEGGNILCLSYPKCMMVGRGLVMLQTIPVEMLSDDIITVRRRREKTPKKSTTLNERRISCCHTHPPWLYLCSAWAFSKVGPPLGSHSWRRPWCFFNQAKCASVRKRWAHGRFFRSPGQFSGSRGRFWKSHGCFVKMSVFFVGNCQKENNRLSKMSFAVTKSLMTLKVPIFKCAP